MTKRLAAICFRRKREMPSDGSPSVLQPMGEAWYEEVEHEPSTERAGL
jgi:hypothetical protein